MQCENILNHQLAIIGKWAVMRQVLKIEANRATTFAESIRRTSQKQPPEIRSMASGVWVFTVYPATPTVTGCTSLME